MVRWWICISTLIAVVIIFFVQLVALIIDFPYSLISNITIVATVLIAGLSMLFTLGAWQFPQQQGPQPLSVKAKKRIFGGLVALSLLGVGACSGVGFYFHVLSPFDRAVWGKPIQSTD